MNKPFLSRILPEVGEAMRGEEGRIGYLLRQASVAHHAKVDQVLKEFGVTLPQYSVLAFLDLYPGISNADLARLTLLTPQTLSVIVANLEKAGAISRSPHPVHGRIQCIELTEKGRDLHTHCTKKVLQIQEQLASDLSPEEEKVVRRWLVRVAATLSTP